MKFPRTSSLLKRVHALCERRRITFLIKLPSVNTRAAAAAFKFISVSCEMKLSSDGKIRDSLSAVQLNTRALLPSIKDKYMEFMVIPEQAHYLLKDFSTQNHMQFQLAIILKNA